MGAYEFPSLKDDDARWMQNAACRNVDYDIFFPEAMSDASAAAAVSMCNRCPVQDDCARYAIINSIEYGIWGGLSPVHDAKSHHRHAKKTVHANN